MSLGCVMENMWLAAESMGIGLQIVSSLSSDPEVRRILGIPDDLVIAFSCRLGYPVSEPPKYLRVRRDVRTSPTTTASPPEIGRPHSLLSRLRVPLRCQLARQ